jgi:lactate permease
MPIWSQSYDPLGNIFLSALVAAIPAILLLVLVAVCNFRIHLAALIALAACVAIALGMYRMPVAYALAGTIYGAGYGLFPIGWLVLNIIFIYQLTVQRGLFDVLRRSLARVAPDPRIQIILIAFAFGSFLEGMSGFGAPVAITAAILIQLRFPPLQASALALVANTAPVAFGSLGIPLTTLQQVTDLDVRALSATVGALLVPFSFAIPFLIVTLLSGWRGLAGVWPAALVAGLCYVVPQYLFATYHGPSLAAPIAGLCCIVALVGMLRVWRPRELWAFDAEGRLGPATGAAATAEPVESGRKLFEAWLPWLILTVLILIWGLPIFSGWMLRLCPAQFNMPYLDSLIQRTPPVVAHAALIKAPFKLDVLKETGTGIFLAAIIIGVLTGCSLREWLKLYGETIWKIRLSLLTIATMLALGNVFRYSGTDGTLGLALAHTGSFYPFFGTMLGWIGAAITGSDTSSNVLFGSLQKVTAQRIVVASTATNWYGHEGRILRYVFLPSVILAALMGALVFLAAYVAPFTAMVSK